jgi:hypothetical protein
MNNLRATQERSTATTGFARGGLQTLEAPAKSRAKPGRAAVNFNPQPPIQPVSERFPALERQEILLTFFAPVARAVSVASDFNGWRPDATPLKKSGAGRWAVRLLLRSGQYEYRFVVDGWWREDPSAFQRAANPYGGFNSVLTVPLSVKTSIL